MLLLLLWRDRKGEPGMLRRDWEDGRGRETRGEVTFPRVSAALIVIDCAILASPAEVTLKDKHLLLVLLLLLNAGAAGATVSPSPYSPWANHTA